MMMIGGCCFHRTGDEEEQIELTAIRTMAIVTDGPMMWHTRQSDAVMSLLLLVLIAECNGDYHH